MIVAIHKIDGRVTSERVEIFIGEELSKKGWLVDYEVAINPDRTRVADVLASKGNRRVAHEVQLSRVSLQVLIERTQDYVAEGIEIIWWLSWVPPYQDTLELARMGAEVGFITVKVVMQ